MTPTTRERIITAAEELFAERGIDAVSLREINRAAGAKSAVAVQYHFDDRAGVLRAILDKHRAAVDTARHAVLDHLEAEATPSLRDMAGALVRPLAAKLGDPDGGPAYLQINAELVHEAKPLVDPTDAAAPAPGRARNSLHRWRAAVEPLLDPQAVELHRRFAAIRFSAVELGRRAATAPHRDDRLFVEQLVDLTCGLLAAPLSEETRRLAGERPRRRAAS
ncbi:helix-turn-helix domain-containing protein [Actinomarinicola tropica]|uniref:TetR family transcriptional regulator n=1 Tax=Actinomarinicola tropica TaxID=2789776 RepID=A0A5Q2RPF8_9ACTN|nr:helix-turn-helix domain-containing protein [Actinomarinicola tropica]QGG96471.1 TetR family transcriptional regulator [Actinomarinicola tropica]